MPERTITIQTARRLAVTRQHLAGPYPVEPDGDAILRVARDLGCLQLDPIRVVARSHLLVLASRLGPFDVKDLDRLLWEERRLFEYWAHRASIVLTEDFPIHARLMRDYGNGPRARHDRFRVWLAANDSLRRRILREVRSHGPIRSRDVAGTDSVDWVSKGWTGGRNVSQMLDYLWTKGSIAVAGRHGLEKLWDLASRWYPEWTPRQPLSPRQVTERAAPRSLRSLGVATPKQIAAHFIPGRYRDLPIVIERLQKRGVMVPARMVEDGAALPGPWFVHADDLAAVEEIERGGFEPRTVLLSPFDNLIWDRQRAATLFCFDFRTEIYVPKQLRRYGYYTMPVLSGDRIVAVADPAFDRSSATLRVGAIHLLDGISKTRAARAEIMGAAEDLARFLRASHIELPQGWR